MRTLFIGETAASMNNFLWAYHRHQAAVARHVDPAGGESTGLHAVDEINGHSSWQLGLGGNVVMNTLAGSATGRFHPQMNPAEDAVAWPS